MAFLDSLGSFAGNSGAAAGTAVGNILGSYASSAMQYYFNKDLMAYANDLNKDNLRNGPSIQREGLEAAGYNPLLALSGYTSGLPSVSPMSVGHSDLSNLGSSAMSAYKMKAEADTERERKDVVKAEVDVKKAASSDLEKSAELKDALKKKADADATKTKVEMFSEPARVVTSALGAGATAYGAKKAVEAFKASKNLKADQKVIDLLGKSKKTSSAVSAASALLRYSPYLLAPFTIGAPTAYGLHKLYEKSKPGSALRRVMDMPNYGSRLR